MLCIQNGALSPMYLHIPASDISQGQNWCCVFKKVQYRQSFCILLHPIYQKDKTVFLYSKRCNSCCEISPLPLHIAASDISQGQNWCCIFKKVQYCLSFCILLHPICHKDKTAVVYSKRCNLAYVFANVY